MVCAVSVTRRTMMETKADKYSRFDAGDYLDGTEDAAAYLQIALRSPPTTAPSSHAPSG